MTKKTKIEANLCVGCGVCSDVCPNEAIQLVDGSAQLVHAENCKGCGICEEFCEQGAIKVSEEN